MSEYNTDYIHYSETRTILREREFVHDWINKSSSWHVLSPFSVVMVLNSRRGSLCYISPIVSPCLFSINLGVAAEIKGPVVCN